jgi:hypothetical protein
MPDGVIATVEEMARNEQQPLIGHGAPLFEWSPGIAIVDLIEDPLLYEGNEDNVEETDVEENDEQFDDNSDEEGSGDDIDDANDNDDDYPDEEGSGDDMDGAHDNDEVSVSEGTEFGQDDVVDHVGEPRSNSGSDIGADQYVEEFAEHDPDAGEVPDEGLPNGEPMDGDHRADDNLNARNHDGYNLRSNRGRNYDHRLSHVMDNPANSRSYDAQLFQYGGDSVKKLCEEVQEMQRSGLSNKVHRHMMVSS